MIDETVTPMGARVLADRLANPLTGLAAINERLDAVEELTQDVVLARDLREELERAYDLERLTARVATGRAGPRDLACLARTLSLLPKLKARLSARHSRRLVQLEEQLDLCGDVRAEIERCSPTNHRWERPRGTSFAPASIRSSTSCAVVRRQGMDRPLSGRGNHPHGHRQSQSRLQPRLWLLPGGHRLAGEQGARRLHAEANAQKPGAIHHAAAQGARGESAPAPKSRPSRSNRSCSPLCASGSPAIRDG